MHFLSLYNLYKTNRFQVAVHLFSTESQMMSKFVRASVTPWLNSLCDPFFCLDQIFTSSVLVLLNSCIPTWNLFVKCIYYDQVLPFRSTLT